MSIEPIMQRAAAACIRRLGDSATYNATPLVVAIERGVEYVGEYGQVVETRTQARLLHTDVAAPAAGDTLVVTTGRHQGTYTVREILADDGYIWTLGL